MKLTPKFACTVTALATVLGLVAAVQLVAAVAPPPAAASTAQPCHDWSFTKPAHSRFKRVTVDGRKAFVVGPRHPASSTHPGIVLLPGSGGTSCSLWWAARLLAGRDYVTLLVHYGTKLAAADIAGHKGLKWLRTATANPWHGKMRLHDMAIIGHSLGAHAAADLQQTEDVKTIVALDNLRAYIKNDRSAGTDCLTTAPKGPIKAKVPALSLGSETSCLTSTPYGNIANKLTGFDQWLSQGVPVVQATLADSQHAWYTGTKDFTIEHTRQLTRSSAYMLDWLALWMRNKVSLYPKFVSAKHYGIPLRTLLSGRAGFGSAAYLPARGKWSGTLCWDLHVHQCGPVLTP